MAAFDEVDAGADPTDVPKERPPAPIETIETAAADNDDNADDDTPPAGFATSPGGARAGVTERAGAGTGARGGGALSGAWSGTAE